MKLLSCSEKLQLCHEFHIPSHGDLESKVAPGLQLHVFSCVRFFVAQWTVGHQAPLSMEFSRQEYWSELQFPSPGNLPDPGIEPTTPVSPPLADGFLTTAPPGKSHSV